MKQKLLSWGDDFYIRDENGRDVYFVDGKALSFGGRTIWKPKATSSTVNTRSLAVVAWLPPCRNDGSASPTRTGSRSPTVKTTFSFSPVPSSSISPVIPTSKGVTEPEIR
jgi:hypothetical protein